MPLIELILLGITLVLIGLYSSWVIIFLLPKQRKRKRFTPKISILIPAYNEGLVIRDTLQSLLDAKYPNEKEIIVINDGSQDNTAEIVAQMSKKHPEIRLLNSNHQGKSAALNKGIENSKFEVIVTLDADSVVGKASLLELVNPLQEKDVGGVSGIIRAKLTPNPLTWFQDFDYIISSAWRYVYNKLGATFVFPGFAAFRREALEKIKGFKRDTLTEDVDIGLYLRNLGYRGEMSSAVMYTEVPQTLRSYVRQRFRWARGVIQVMRKHRNFLFSKDQGLLGMYTLPTQLYWYLHSLIYLPLVLYQIIDGYFRYFLAYDEFFSFGVFKYFFSWMTTYGMLEMIYRTVAGNQWTLVSALTIIVFLLYSSQILLIFLKLVKPRKHHLFAYLCFFPFILLILAVQNIALAYEMTKPRVANIWEK